jgi:hypothetical protein
VKPQEVYLAWAPTDSIWSPWAIPVPFAQIVCVPINVESDLNGIQSLAEKLIPAPDLAVVLDLPGEQSARLGLALAMRGFRPVPVIDGSPGPDVLGTVKGVLLSGPTVVADRSIAVDMRQLMRWLCIGAVVLPSFNLTPNARPVFILDALRTGTANSLGPEVFDNRWKTFPQDFPSARFLKEQGISQVLLIQTSASEPSEDLGHVLLRWQEDGIAIHVASASNVGSSHPIQIHRPPLFRTLWYRALALIGLKRAANGGFGAWPHGSGGG